MNLKVLTHSGKEFEVTVETYDPEAMNSQLNSNDVYTVLIGDMIFSRVDIKRIEPVKAEASEAN